MAVVFAASFSTVAAQQDSLFRVHPTLSPELSHPGMPPKVLSLPGVPQWNHRHRTVIFPLPPDSPWKPAPAPIGTRHAPELADPYLGETFYPHLATLLWHNRLPMKWRTRLDDYRARRDIAAAELRATLARYPISAPEARRQALADLAARQQKELIALEQEAADLEDVLRSGDWNRDGFSWGDFVHYQNRRSSGNPPTDIEYLLAVRYFASGLTGPQRELLDEMLLELMSAEQDEENETVSYIRLPPRALPVPLPATLSPRATVALERYRTAAQREKERLWKALISDVQDRRQPPRRATLTALAEQQEADLVRLAALADDLRQSLADDLIAPAESIGALSITDLWRQVGLPPASSHAELMARTAAALPGLSMEQRRLLVRMTWPLLASSEHL